MTRDIHMEYSVVKGGIKATQIHINSDLPSPQKDQSYRDANLFTEIDVVPLVDSKLKMQLGQNVFVMHVRKKIKNKILNKDVSRLNTYTCDTRKKIMGKQNFNLLRLKYIFMVSQIRV